MDTRRRYLVLAMRTEAFDQAAVAPHLAFLDEARLAGQLEMTGGFSDGSGGAYVLSAGSLQEAQEIAARDPLATRGASTLRVYEWNTR